MKRTISFLLVVLLLLNVMGFYGVFIGLKYSNTSNLLDRFDENNYSHLSPQTIRVPISIPYFGNTEYQRVDGEIEHNGEFYRLVKQRYQNDTLYIVCVKDTHGKNISRALSDYVKTFTDQPSTSSQGKSVVNFIKDYLITEIEIGTASIGWNYGLTVPTDCGSFDAVSINIISPPPET